jgi:hypothetical protein
MLWYELDGDERARNLEATVHGLDSMRRARYQRQLRSAQLFEGRRLLALSPSAYNAQLGALDFRTDEIESLRVNIVRNLVQTAVAKIACKQKPRAMFCTSGGDWTTARRARKLERFVEAVKASRQGMHLDAHDINTLVFRDCCWADLGCKYWYADHDSGRICVERVPPWEILADPNEARTGDPLSIFRVYPSDRGRLKAQFPAHAGQIEMAACATSADIDGPFELVGSDRQVTVVEGWRRAVGDTPGAHCIAVAGVDLTDGEAWTREIFPFEFMVWEPQLIGMYGTSLIDTMRGIGDEYARAFERYAEAERLCSNMVLVVEKGSISEEQLGDNRPGIVIEYEKGAPPPTFQVPQSVGPASVQWIQILEAMGFRISGIGEQAATGQKAQGVDSAIAMRTVSDIETERFALQWLMFERVCAIGDARQIIACARELVDADVEVKVHTSGYRVQDEMLWKDVAIDIPDEAIQVYAVSGLVNTPPDRIALGEKLFSAGVISKTSYLRILQAKDVDAELDGNNGQSALLDHLIETWLDQDDPASESYVKAQQLPVSLNWMDLESAIVQVGRAFMQAELDRAPSAVLELFAIFMAAADRKLQERQAATAALASQTVPQGVPQ